MTKEKIAFIVVRYGININGGAEYHCRMLAERLTNDYDVEVLTTFIDNYLTGESLNVKDVETINHVLVRRFKTNPIHPELEHKFKREAKPAYKLRKFLYQYHLLSLVSKVFPIWHFKETAELNVLKSQIFHSSPLFDFIRVNKSNYKAIIPITTDYAHVYYTTLFAAERTIIIPTLHYQKSSFRSILTFVFTKAAHIGFNTLAEQRLAERIFGKHMSPHSIVSVGIELSNSADWDTTIRKYNLPDEYILYVGRIEPGKLNNIYNYFISYKQAFPKSQLKFVLVGKQYGSPSPHPDIVYTGFVSEEEKIAIIEHAKIVINPSLRESLSLILLEAMALKKAMLVNGHCSVLKEHCEKSNFAALYYTNQKSFIRELHKLDSSSKLRIEMGEKGATYVDANYNWDIIMRRINKIIETLTTTI